MRGFNTGPHTFGHFTPGNQLVARRGSRFRNTKSAHTGLRTDRENRTEPGPGHTVPARLGGSATEMKHNSTPKRRQDTARGLSGQAPRRGPTKASLPAAPDTTQADGAPRGRPSRNPLAPLAMRAPFPASQAESGAWETAGKTTRPRPLHILTGASSGETPAVRGPRPGRAGSRPGCTAGLRGLGRPRARAAPTLPSPRAASRGSREHRALKAAGSPGTSAAPPAWGAAQAELRPRDLDGPPHRIR